MAGALTALMGAVGCGSTEPDPFGPHDVLARLQIGSEQAVVATPDTVTAGTPFTVDFTSFAGGCTSTVAHVDVLITGARAEVHGYDHDSGGPVCTANAFMLHHDATVQFDQPGTATVQVIGAAIQSPSDDPTTSVVVLSRTVVVR